MEDRRGKKFHFRRNRKRLHGRVVYSTQVFSFSFECLVRIQVSVGLGRAVSFFSTRS